MRRTYSGSLPSAALQLLPIENDQGSFNNMMHMMMADTTTTTTTTTTAPSNIDSISSSISHNSMWMMMAAANAETEPWVQPAIWFLDPFLNLMSLAMLARVVIMLEDLSMGTPVILATHSDRLLDSLADPGSSVILCDLNDRGVTRLRRPNPESLASWLADYQGVGRVRAEGYTELLFEAPPVRDGGAQP